MKRLVDLPRSADLGQQPNTEPQHHWQCVISSEHDHVEDVDDEIGAHEGDYALVE